MECDVKINEIATQYTATLDAPKAEMLRSEKYNAKKNRIGFDIEKTAFEMVDAFKKAGGSLIAKDYPSWEDINVEREWADWAMNVILANSEL